MRQKAVHAVELELDEYTIEGRQIDIVNIDFINSNAKSLGIIAKLKDSYQNSTNISYKIDMGSNSNILPFHIYKIIFPRSTKKLLS